VSGQLVKQEVRETYLAAGERTLPKCTTFRSFVRCWFRSICPWNRREGVCAGGLRVPAQQEESHSLKVLSSIAERMYFPSDKSSTNDTGEFPSWMSVLRQWRLDGAQPAARTERSEDAIPVEMHCPHELQVRGRGLHALGVFTSQTRSDSSNCGEES